MKEGELFAEARWPRGNRRAVRRGTRHEAVVRPRRVSRGLDCHETGHPRAPRPCERAVPDTRSPRVSAVGRAAVLRTQPASCWRRPLQRVGSQGRVWMFFCPTFLTGRTALIPLSITVLLTPEATVMVFRRRESPMPACARRDIVAVAARSWPFRGGGPVGSPGAPRAARSSRGQPPACRLPPRPRRAGTG